MTWGRYPRGAAFSPFRHLDIRNSSLIRHSDFVIRVFMRTLSIDLGTRRVGLAMSDGGGRFATPYDVLQVTSAEQATDLVLALIVKEGVERIVVGLPLNM